MAVENEKNIMLNKCPVCTCTEKAVVKKTDKFKLLQCSKCHLVYLSNVQNDFDSMYTKDSGSSTSAYYANSAKSDIKTFNARLEIIERYIPKGRLLDIGCSTGTMPEAAKNRGWNAAGIEPNPRSAEICREKGIEVYNEFMTKRFSAEHQNEFDAVYLGDVIEHVTNPVEMMDNSLLALKNGGILMIVTPDYNSRIARFFQIKPNEHLLYFNINSLKYLIGKFDTEIEMMARTTRNRDLAALQYSSTFSSRPVLKKSVNILSALRLNSVVNFFIKLFVRDEIIAVVRKK